MLSPKNRAYLKGLANHLKPSLNIGKGDIDQSILEVLDKALEAHELVKVRVLETAPSTFDEIADSLCKGTNSHFVGKTGHIITLYRESKKNKTITLPHK